MFHRGALPGIRRSDATTDSRPVAIGLASGDVRSRSTALVANAQQLLDLRAELDQLTTVGLSVTCRGQPLVQTPRLR